MQSLTPQEIVAELDRYIVGQKRAKKSVAVALRNRWRRRQLPDELAQDVYPKNILLIGPTGVGKTEIARRLAGLAKAPFLKVEASKYSEVGYHGRDVESHDSRRCRRLAVAPRPERGRKREEVRETRSPRQLRRAHLRRPCIAKLEASRTSMPTIGMAGQRSPHRVCGRTAALVAADPERP